ERPSSTHWRNIRLGARRTSPRDTWMAGTAPCRWSTSTCSPEFYTRTRDEFFGAPRETRHPTQDRYSARAPERLDCNAAWHDGAALLPAPQPRHADQFAVGTFSGESSRPRPASLTRGCQPLKPRHRYWTLPADQVADRCQVTVRWSRLPILVTVSA